MADKEKRDLWTGDSSQRRRRSKGRNGAAVECYNCRGLGHLARICPSDCYTCGCGDSHLSRDCPRRKMTFHKQQQQQQILLLRNSSGLYTFDLETLIPNKYDSQTIPASTLNLAPSLLPRLSHLPVATCNGLMLILPPKKYSGLQITWEIWNTLTQERLELLPPPQNRSPDRYDFLGFVGLGYDRSSDDYKAVAIVVHDFSELQPHVYSLKSDTWTRKWDLFCSVSDFEHHWGQGAFLGGALHWISPEGFDMFSFDVGTDTFHEFKSPSGLRLRDRQYFIEREFNVAVLDGCLAVCDYGHDDDDLKQHFDIWVMKEYGVEDSWTLLYKLPAIVSGYPPRPSLRGLSPVACMNKDKRQLLMQDGRSLYLVDVEKKSTKIVDIQGFSDGHVTAQVFHGSIFRLHDNCGVTAGRRRRRRRTREIIKSNNNTVDTQLLFRVRDSQFGDSRHEKYY